MVCKGRNINITKYPYKAPMQSNKSHVLANLCADSGGVIQSLQYLAIIFVKKKCHFCYLFLWCYWLVPGHYWACGSGLAVERRYPRSKYHEFQKHSINNSFSNMLFSVVIAKGWYLCSVATFLFSGKMSKVLNKFVVFALDCSRSLFHYWMRKI